MPDVGISADERQRLLLAGAADQNGDVANRGWCQISEPVLIRARPSANNRMRSPSGG